jgi:hypothetical protein
MPSDVRLRQMHLRAPSIDHGVASFLWAFGFGLYLFVGMWAIGVSKGTAFIFGALAGAAIFLFVRRFGEEERQARRSSPRMR